MPAQQHRHQQQPHKVKLDKLCVHVARVVLFRRVFTTGTFLVAQQRHYDAVNILNNQLM
jgi:hypothetical protein